MASSAVAKAPSKPRTGSPHRTRGGDRGFVMVALLVGMAVAAIWMTAALPAWRQQVQRQREEDLIFRGEQYARAIVLFQEKNQGNLPPSIDVLVSQHFLRKKWKDPVTNDDFLPVGTGIGIGQPGQQPMGTGQPAPGAGQQPPGRGGQANQPAGGGAAQPPGISGVRSKSTATSIKIYQNQQQHNLWQFDAALIRGRMRGQPLANQPPGGRGNQPGGRQGGAGNRGAPAGIGGQPGRGGDQQVRPGGPPAGGRGGIPVTPIGRGGG